MHTANLWSLQQEVHLIGILSFTANVRNQMPLQCLILDYITIDLCNTFQPVKRNRKSQCTDITKHFSTFQNVNIVRMLSSVDIFCVFFMCYTDEYSWARDSRCVNILNVLLFFSPDFHIAWLEQIHIFLTILQVQAVQVNACCRRQLTAEAQEFQEPSSVWSCSLEVDLSHPRISRGAPGGSHGSRSQTV